MPVTADRSALCYFYSTSLFNPLMQSWVLAPWGYWDAAGAPIRHRWGSGASLPAGGDDLLRSDSLREVFLASILYILSAAGYAGPVR